MEKKQWWEWNLERSPTDLFHFLLFLLLEKSRHAKVAVPPCEQLPCPCELMPCSHSLLPQERSNLCAKLCVLPVRKSSFGMSWLL